MHTRTWKQSIAELAGNNYTDLCVLCYVKKRKHKSLFCKEHHLLCSKPRSVDQTWSRIEHLLRPYSARDTCPTGNFKRRKVTSDETFSEIIEMVKDKDFAGSKNCDDIPQRYCDMCWVYKDRIVIYEHDEHSHIERNPSCEAAKIVETRLGLVEELSILPILSSWISFLMVDVLSMISLQGTTPFPEALGTRR